MTAINSLARAAMVLALISDISIGGIRVSLVACLLVVLCSYKLVTRRYLHLMLALFIISILTFCSALTLDQSLWSCLRSFELLIAMAISFCVITILSDRSVFRVTKSAHQVQWNLLAVLSCLAVLGITQRFLGITRPPLVFYEPGYLGLWMPSLVCAFICLSLDSRSERIQTNYIVLGIAEVIVLVFLTGALTPLYYLAVVFFIV